MSVLDEQQVADKDLAADHELELSAQLQSLEDAIAFNTAQLKAALELLDETTVLLRRAEPLLKLAEGWARFRGFGRG